jgi:hypothetical protein
MRWKVGGKVRECLDQPGEVLAQIVTGHGGRGKGNSTLDIGGARELRFDCGRLEVEGLS